MAHIRREGDQCPRREEGSHNALADRPVLEDLERVCSMKDVRSAPMETVPMKAENESARGFRTNQRMCLFEGVDDAWAGCLRERVGEVRGQFRRRRWRGGE